MTPGVHFIPLALRTSSPYALPNLMTISIFIVTSSLCCLSENVDQYEVYCSRLLSDLDCFRQTFESIPMVQPCTSVHSDQNTWNSFHFHFRSVAVHTKLFIQIKTRGILSTSTSGQSQCTRSCSFRLRHVEFFPLPLPVSRSAHEVVHSDQDTWNSFHFHFRSVAVHTKLFVQIKTRGILPTSRFSARSSLAVPPPLLARYTRTGRARGSMKMAIVVMLPILPPFLAPPYTTLIRSTTKSQ